MPYTLKLLLWAMLALVAVRLLVELVRLLVPRPRRHLRLLEGDGGQGSTWGLLARGVSAALELVRRVRDRGGLMATWTIEVIGPDGTVKASRYLPRTRVNLRRGRNLIVNTGLDYVKERLHNPATASLPMSYVAVGTGAVPEVPADIALGAEVVRSPAVTYTPGGTGVCTVDYTFPAAGGYEPAVITEAGMFNNPGAGLGTMLNRKVFPAVTKTAADTLKVSCLFTWSAA